MTISRPLIYLLYFLYCYSTYSNSYVLLYHTENSLSVQYYDCIYYTQSEIQNNIQGVKYCRQLNESQLLHRDFNQSCHNGGILRSFEELSLLNISASDVLRWSSSMEQVDRYLKYLSNSSLDIGDKYMCNCTNPSSFGKFCEYEFYGDSTSFDDAITKQFASLANIDMTIDMINVGSQLHNNRPCYITLICNSGLMCLDWRHICDGKQQCMDGLDEDFCEKLEFNECEDDEYRCANGMCIPDEYWLDGDYDCMDWTDEVGIITSSGYYCSNMLSFVCDEHLCPYNQWSCGDGQCINDKTDRQKGTYYGDKRFCKNMRDVNYMCEAVTRDSKSWWTINGGYCLHYSLPYQTLSLDTTAMTSKCVFSVKCALSNSLDQDCQCKNATACRKMVNSSCTNLYLLYPGSDPILAPYIDMLYARDRDWANKKPDRIGYKGRVKCIGYQLITIKSQGWIHDERFSFYDYKLSAQRLCSMEDENYSIRNSSGPKYDVNCWNNSKTFNNHSYQVSFLCQTRCISKYRVRDGIVDCFLTEEFSTRNNSCPQIQRHRLQCSSSEMACLLASALGNWASDCSNGRDEFDYESNIVIKSDVACKKRYDSGCVYLRNYIQSLSHKDPEKEIVIDNSMTDDYSTTIPFRSYCNSFFDFNSGMDELPEFCEKWICLFDQYQCLSGQCIPQDWVCDGEWDCSDGSDEERIFIMDHLKETNSKLMNLTEIKQRCYQHYRSINTPFSDICNISFEYPCFRTDANDPLNLTLNRPCINLTQIGDGKTDCLSGFDERNRLQCSNKGMLGFQFQFDDNRCAAYVNLCTSHYPWIPGTNIAYDTVCFYQRKQFKNGTNSTCNSLNDVMCLNDVCIKGARCNGKIECLHGEDEYRCLPQNTSQLSYRRQKQLVPFVTLDQWKYPSSIQLMEKNHAYYLHNTISSLSLLVSERNTLSNLITKLESVDNETMINITNISKVKSVYEIVRDSLPSGRITFEEHYLPFICNRGLAVKYYTGDTICFCSPSFYGSQCQFYSDRITIVTHLDLTNYGSYFHQIAVIKVLTRFLLKNQTIDYYEFHVNPQTQTNNNYVKQGIYFLYPRLKEFIQMKTIHHSDIQLYSVRFEAFNLYFNETIQPIGVWQYPIYFDFLSSFRLSKILRFNPPVSLFSNQLCFDNPCGKNGICLEIINSNHSLYFCSCNSGYYGIHCEYYDEECKEYCSPKSICKPKHSGIIRGNEQPLCLCSTSTFGDRCYLKNNNCRNNPCLNGGTCILDYDLAHIDSYTCLCTDSFKGDHCQFEKEIVEITFVLSSDFKLQMNHVVATTVSYNDYDNKALRLNVRHQQVYSGLPEHLKLIYSHKLGTYAPTTAILKVYGRNYSRENPNYYVLYFDPGEKKINITIDLTSEKHCPFVQTLWNLVQGIQTSDYSSNLTFNATTAVFSYHHICQAKQNTNTSFTCFHDLNYLCMCEPDYYRAECFGYDLFIDQCSLCLSNGFCLNGELDKPADFLCLCSHCHYGKICEFSNELMSFTLDSLTIKDLQINAKLSTNIYISITILIFLFGLFNNLSSLLAFARPKSRQFGVGNYLLIVSGINQCSLLLLLLKIIHIILGSNGTLFYYVSLNLYSCKIISYLLSVFTRITNWLVSLVTIERLCMVLFPTSILLKKPRLAFGLTTFVILVVSGMHVHEIMHYMTIVDPSYTSINITLCVTSYVQQLVSVYNRVNVLIHYFAPFAIQIISITILIIQVARSRARTKSSTQDTFIDVFKKEFNKHKELYVTPMIIVLSSLPQVILSFSYACTEPKQSWQRYILLTTYFLSYLPQTLGFILYVLPSTTYTEEFYQTIIGKRLVRSRQGPTAARKQNIEMKTRSTKPTVPHIVSS